MKKYSSHLKLYMVAVLLCIAVFAANAQSVTGRAIDESLQPIPFASVVMLENNDSSFITGTVTGEDGRFTLPTRTEKALIRLSCIGYRTIYEECPVQEDMTDGQKHDLGDIVMHADGMTLDDVVINGRTPIHKMTQEGVSTNITGTVLEQLGTAEDVLGKIPGVIRNRKSFEVFGKGTPLIYINRRKIQDIAELERLRAEEIKNIEVITSPGSRYAATVKAVIKIYTKNVAGDGMGIDVRSAYYQSENTDIAEQMNLRYRHAGLDVFGHLDYSLSNNESQSQSNTYIVADTIWNQCFVQKTKNEQQELKCVTGLNYSFNTMHSAGIRYELSLDPRNKTNSTFYSDVMADNKYYDRLDNRSKSYGESRPVHVINMYYLGKIGKVDIDFNADWLSGTSSEHSVYYEKSADHEDRTVNTRYGKQNNMFASKLVMGHHILGGGFTAGAEFTRTSRHDDYVNEEQYVPTSRSNIKEVHLTPFIEYSHTLTKYAQLSVGARYEHVNFDYYENDVRIADQSKTFSNIFPSMSLNMQLGKIALQLAYITKTRRPDYRQLSNNVTYGNRFLLQSGNSRLKHEYIHSLSLTGLWKCLQMSLGYNDRRDAVITWAEQLEDNNAVSKFTYVNIPTLKSMTASIALSHNIGVWSPQITAGVTKQWLRLTTDIRTYRMNTPSWMFSTSHALRLAHGWIMSADAWMKTRGNDENFYSRKCVGAVNIDITKWMMKNKLSVQLRGKDIFRTLKSDNESYAGRVHTQQASSYDSREVVLKVIYRLNMTRSKYKGTGAGNEEKNRL